MLRNGFKRKNFKHTFESHMSEFAYYVILPMWVGSLTECWMSSLVKTKLRITTCHIDTCSSFCLCTYEINRRKCSGEL